MFENFTMYGAIKEASLKYPKESAIWYEGNSISYKSFLRKIDEMSSILQHGLCINKNDVVILAQPNIPDVLTIFYALNKIGAITFFVHPLTPCNQLIDLVKKSNAKYAFVFEQMVAKEIDKYISIKDICIVTRIENYLPSIKKSFYHTFMNKEVRKTLGNTFTYIHSLKASNEPVLESNDNEKCSVMLNSGSTTGDAKTICLNDKAFNVLASQACSFLSCEPEFAVGKGMISILPSFHGFGLGMTMHAPICNGFPSVLIPKLTIKRVCTALKKTNAFSICGVPTLYNYLLDNEEFRKCKYINKLYVCYCGGDTLPQQTIDRWDELMKEHQCSCKLFEGFGLTEAIAVNCVNTYKHNKNGSIGYPIEGSSFKIVDESRNELGVNTVGEIVIKSPLKMIGYFNDVEATNKALVDGWIYTGDLGYIDKDGYIYFKQRKKRVVKVSGVAIFPTEIEKYVLGVFPAIKEACAIEIPDEKLGHAIKLFITPKQSEEMINRVKKACQSYLIRWAVPKEIESVDSLPKTLLGKVDFNKLTIEEKERRGK